MTDKEATDKWYKVYCEDNLKKYKEESLTKKMSELGVAEMRERLAESEWESLKDRDLKQILWDGCEGWVNMNDDYITQMYEDVFGEEEK